MDSRDPIRLALLCDDVRAAVEVVTREAHPSSPPVPFPDLDPEPDPLLSLLMDAP